MASVQFSSRPVRPIAGVVSSPFWTMSYFALCKYAPVRATLGVVSVKCWHFCAALAKAGGKVVMDGAPCSCVADAPGRERPLARAHSASEGVAGPEDGPTDARQHCWPQCPRRERAWPRELEL